MSANAPATSLATQNVLVSQNKSATDSRGSKFNGFIAGVASGCAKLTVGHPFDTIKVRMQTEGGHGRFKGPLDCLKKTLGREGLRGLYKGATPPLFGWAVMDAVMLGSLTNFKSLLKWATGREQLNYFHHGLAGMGSGCCVCIVATPIELIKAQLQVQYDASTKRYTGPIDCAQQIYKNHGIAGLWRGMGSNLLHRSHFAILWMGFEFYTKAFTDLAKRYNISDRLVPFFAGGMAANTFWCYAFPLDVIKNRIMSQPDKRPLQFPSIASCFKQTYAKEGIRGFYRGFLPCILRSFPANGCALLAFDTVMRLLD